MRRIQPNLLGDGNGLYRRNDNGNVYFASTFNSNWIVYSPSTLLVVDDVARSSRRFSLRLTNSTNAPIRIETTQNDIPQPYGSFNLIFNALLLCESETAVSVYIHDPNLPYTSVEPNTQTTIPSVWSPIFSNEGNFGDTISPNTSVRVTVIINGANNLPVFFSSPNLTHADPDLYNQFVILSQRFFPDIIRGIDDKQTNPRRPLMKLFHSLTAQASLMMDEYIRIFPYDNDELGPAQYLLRDTPANIQARSQMTDVAIMSHDYMEWAAMFIGTRLLQDVQVSGNSVFTQENFEFHRWQLASKAYGLSSGNRNSIKEAVRNVLSGSQLVLVTSIWDGNPWQIMIRTLTSETPSVVSAGDTSQEVLAVAEFARPAGYILLHEVVDEFSFVLNDVDFGVFDQNVLG